jgi:hypothetical protein
MSALTSIVSSTYRHVEKTAYPTGVAGTMKWYDLREEGRGIPSPVRDDARARVDALVGPDDIGFVILHACGADVTLLLVNRWRNDNELWETVYAQRGDDPFAPVGDADPTRATFCVWELGIVESERLAWADLLRGDHDQAALDGYLAATFSGVV